MERTSELSARMKYAMEQKGIRQTDLEKMSGIGKGALSLYMSGKLVPKTPTVEKISHALDVPVMWLMGYDVPMSVNVDRETTDNQSIADTALRMQDDPEFREAVELIGSLQPDELSAIVTMIRTMRK